MLVFFGVWGLDKKNKMILFPVILVVAAIGLFSAMSFNVDDLSNESKTTTYIPSNITKANPNILPEVGSSSYSTTNIYDVKDNVLYTIEGTILSIGDPIEWISNNSVIQARAAIPITMSIENTYKGQTDSETFTFFLDSFIIIDGITPSVQDLQNYSNVNKKYRLFSFEPQFELGDKVILHIGISDIETNFIDDENLGSLTPYYFVKLGTYGYYKIQNDVAYNEKFPNGIPLNTVISESQ